MKRRSGGTKDKGKHRSESSGSKHGRRRRRSSSSSLSENAADSRPASKTDDSCGNDGSPANRSTRSSRRLAGADEAKLELSVDISGKAASPAKLSPFAENKGSPKKKDTNVWKVKNSNDCGSGEVQKLKLCLKRSPDDVSNNDQSVDESEDDKMINADAKNNTELTENDTEKVVTTEKSKISDDEEDEKKNVEQEEKSEKVENSSVQLEDVPLPEGSPKQSTVINNIINNDISNESAATDESEEEKIEKSNILTEDSNINNAPNKGEESSTDNSETKSDGSDGKVEKCEETEKEQKQSPEKDIRTEEEEKSNQMGSVSSPNEPPQNQSQLNDETISKDTKDNNSSVATKEDAKDHSNSSILDSSTVAEEVFDYENDDGKEEGELSATEDPPSPIHEVFKILSSEERKWNWGKCTTFTFGRSNTSVNEAALRNLQITKRIVSGGDLEPSDSEDLIFVKEIREENIVHEIESENNTASGTREEGEEASEEGELNTTVERQRRKRDRERNRTRSAGEEGSSSNQQVASGANSVPRMGHKIPQNATTVLYITNLVRPFTIFQLKELLQRTGHIVYDGFWIDTIKSKCYVRYETLDDAVESLYALNGINWPPNNPKHLVATFASIEDMVAAQSQVEDGVSRDLHNNWPSYDERPVRKIKDVREWDIGKPAHPDEMEFEKQGHGVNVRDGGGRVRIESDLRITRRRQGSPVDDKVAVRRRRRGEENGVVEEVVRRRGDWPDEEGTRLPAPNSSKTASKSLDELFRKTNSAPSIYWKPLTDAEILVKQEGRKKQLENLRREMEKRREIKRRDPRDRRRRSTSRRRR